MNTRWLLYPDSAIVKSAWRDQIGIPFLLVGLIVLMIGALQEVNIYDEGFAVYGAERILDGDVPYRDFWAIYPPGQFYTLAGVFKVFGVSILAERVFDSLIRLAISLTVFWISRSLSTPRLALIPFSFAVLWMGSVGYHGYAMFPALLLNLIGVTCLFRFLAYRRSLWLGVAGLCIGFAFIYRADVGFYGFIGIVMVTPIAAFVNLAATDESLVRRLARATRLLPPLILGTAFPVVSVLLLLVRHVPAHELWLDLIEFPATVLHRVRSLPLPPVIPNPISVVQGNLPLQSFVLQILDDWVVFYSPLMVFSLGVVAIIHKSRTDATGSSRMTTLRMAVLLVLGVALCTQAISRPDQIHYLPMSLLAVILLPRLILDGQKAIHNNLLLVPIVLWALVASKSYLVDPTLDWLRLARAIQSSIAGGVPSSSLASRAGPFQIDPDQALAVRYVQEHVPESERIFVGNVRHDRIFINDILFYFLADRHSGTKYHELYPGLATTRPVQEGIVTDLQRSGVRYIVLYSGYQEIREPNESGQSSHVLLLDEFIHQNYRQVQSYGPYTIYEKNLELPTGSQLQSGSRIEQRGGPDKATQGGPSGIIGTDPWRSSGVPRAATIGLAFD